MAAKLDMVTKRPVSGETVVTVHPLVLLSVVDHYNRIASGTQRAVGVLLGCWKSPTNLDISNSFAVPFEENAKSPDVWFLDHDYLENMFAMFRKVNAKERIVGWYHTGPTLRPSDMRIHEMMEKFLPHPTLVIIDAHPKDLGLPTKAYVAVEEVHDDGTPVSKTFEHITSEVGAEEVEEVGVEHLLRDITDMGFSGSLSHRLQHQMDSLNGLNVHFSEITEYLELVSSGKLPINHNIMYLVQDIFNMMPDVAGEKLAGALSNKTSDQMLVMYLASTIRATISLHNLINNKEGDVKKPEKDVKEKEKSATDKSEKEGDKSDKANEKPASS